MRYIFAAPLTDQVFIYKGHKFRVGSTYDDGDCDLMTLDGNLGPCVPESELQEVKS